MTLLDFAVQDDGFTMFQLISDPLLAQAKVTTVDKYQGHQNDFIIATWHRNFRNSQKTTDLPNLEVFGRSLVAWISPGSLSSLLLMSQILCCGYQGMTSRCVATGLDNPNNIARCRWSEPHTWAIFVM